MKVIGISGTNGSGKDTLSQLLADNGWLFISISNDLLIPELKKQGLPIERVNMAELSTQWRQQLGMGAVVDKALEQYRVRSRHEKFSGLVISSLRHPGEADRIHKLGGRVIWVDAKPDIRYERIYNRGQGLKDQKSFQQFLAEEQSEMQHSGDEFTLNIGEVMTKADISIENNGSPEEFQTAAKKALALA